MSNDKQIESREYSLGSYFMSDDRYFYIPFFQRSFVWTKDEITELLDDFSEDTDSFSKETSELEGYIMGNMVLISEGQKQTVIDGQQRLTTISLIAKAIHQRIKEICNDTSVSEKIKDTLSDYKGDIKKGYCVCDDSHSSIGLKIRHDDALSFGKVYQNIISDSLTQGVIPDFTKAEDENIYQVYTTIYDYLSGLKEEQFIHFVAYFKTRVFLIVTTAHTQAKAFELFEILNDRGRSLEPMDLIKNLFLKKLSEDKNITEVKMNEFLENWQEMVGNLKLPKKKLSSSTFLKYLLIADKGKNINADGLFDYFKESNEFDSQAILNFSSKMKSTSKIYKDIEKKEYKTFLDDPNMNIIFDIAGIKQFHPILMIFYAESDDNKKKILDAITRWGVAVTAASKQTNIIEKALPELIKSYNNETDKDKACSDMIQTIDGKIKELIPDVKDHISHHNFPGSNGMHNAKATDILKFIELYFNKNNEVLHPALGNNSKPKKISAEHIQSRELDDLKNKKIKLSDLGFANEEEREDYKHRLGNLTLMYVNDNSSAGNPSYKDKMAAYKDSTFRMTSTLVTPLTTTQKNSQETKLYSLINQFEPQYKPQKDHWTKALIDKRGEDLAKLMEAILTNNYT